MKNQTIRFSFLFLLAIVTTFQFSFTLPVQPPRWEMLGSRKVNYTLDRDEIPVTVREGRFDAIKLIVRRAPINLHKVVIHFGNGGVEEVEVRNNIPAGGETRVIDIRGQDRVIQKVVFWYDTKNLSVARGVIELWGRH